MAPAPDFYGLLGFEVVAVSADVSEIGEEGEKASGINLGVGLTSLENRWDARLSYAVLVGSGNVQGLLLLTGGYRF